MERFPWQPSARHAVVSRHLVIAAVTAQGQLTLFIRATKQGEDPLAGVSTRRLVGIDFSG